MWTIGGTCELEPELVVDLPVKKEFLGAALTGPIRSRITARRSLLVVPGQPPGPQERVPAKRGSPVPPNLGVRFMYRVRPVRHRPQHEACWICTLSRGRATDANREERFQQKSK